tara:strand:- start:5572 stop:8826 length:3255 start_codon:yes stop_codon:yes gene_type:complete
MGASKEDFLKAHTGNKNVTDWANKNFDSFNSELQNVGPAVARYNDQAAEYEQAVNRIINDSSTTGARSESVDDLSLKVKIPESYETIGSRAGAVKNSMDENQRLLNTLNKIGPTDDLSGKIQLLDDYVLFNEDENGNSLLSNSVLEDIANAKITLANLKNAKEAIRSHAQKIKSLNDQLKRALEKDSRQARSDASRLDEGYGGTRDFGKRDGESRSDALARRTAALEATKDAFTVANTQNNTSITFREQCLLQANIVKLIKIKRDILEASQPREVPYVFDGRNKALDIEGEPYGFMNKLTQPASTAALFSLPNTILSQLQPYIRLYKVVFDENGKDQYDLPVEFPSHFGQETEDITALLKTSKRRGHGVGLKSFNFSYEGSDPFAIKKSIKASLEIFAASFEEILDDRGGYSYADLALKTGTSEMNKKVKQRSSSAEVQENLSKLNFRLKAVVGYSYPKNLVIPSNYDISAEQIKQAIYNSFVTLNLTPTVHEFDFDDTGRLNFKINYLAYVEDYFDQAYFNIFSDIRATKNTFRRRMLEKAYKENCNLDGLKKLKEQGKKDIELEVKTSMQTLMGGLFENGRVYALNVPYDDLYEAATNPMYNVSSIDKLEQLPGGLDPVETTVERATKTSSEPAAEKPETGWDVEKQQPSLNSNRYEQVAFFFLDDLLDVMMGYIDESLSEDGYQKVIDQLQSEGEMSVRLGAQEKQKIAKNAQCFKKLRILLGPVELKDPTSPNDYVNASLGDIPISAKYFVEWMTSKVIAKNRVYYSISKFINDFVKNYLRNFLNDEKCYGQATKQRITFYSANVTSYPEDDGAETIDEITRYIARNGTSSDTYTGRLNINTIEQSGILNTMGKRNDPRSLIDGGEMNYMVFFAGRTHPKSKQQGSYFDDSLAGVFHYVLGKDSGVVKNIKLDRNTITGLKELRFEQEGFDGLEQLREVYDVSIDTFAMPTTYPGTYIFVDPRGFAPETNPYDGSPSNKNGLSLPSIELTKFGIGGYFMIYKSETTLREGLAETKISAKWVSGMESEATVAGTADTEIESNPDTFRGVRKCAARTDREVPAKPRGIQAANEDTVSSNPNP